MPGLRRRHRGHRSRGLAVALAAEQLLAAGCRRLAVVSSGARTASLLGRLDAFRDRAAEAGVPVRVWQEGPTDYSTGRDAALAMLADDAIDGAFCVTDLIALGFLDAARLDCGSRVPDDLSVIGFDDIPQAGWNAYQLTTFRQPVRMLTDAVMEVMRRRARTAEIAACARSRCPATLVVRRTVRGPRRAGECDMTRPQVVAHRGSSARARGEQLGGLRGGGRRRGRCDRMRRPGHARRRIGHPARSGDRGSTGGRVRVRRDRGEEPGLVRPRRPPRLGAARQRSVCWSRSRTPLARCRSATMVAASSVARADRDRRFPWAGAGRGKGASPAIRTSLMMGSVVAPEELVAARRGLPRRRRAPMLGSPVAASASVARRDCDRTAAASAGSRSRCGTRNARANCGRWLRFGPTPSAPTRPRCCDESWMARNCDRQRDWPPDASRRNFIDAANDRAQQEASS